MSQIFHRSTNTLSKLSIYGAAFIVVVVGGALYEVNESPYFTDTNVAFEQPVPFSHKHHVSEDGIDCRYCHTSVEKSSFAGVPSTETCMTCHSQIWTDAEMLAPVRTSLATSMPLKWNRVHDLPDYVYFNHSIHVANGVGCSTCHGQLDRMPLTWRTQTLYMKWCLECHRAPQNFVRPTSEIYNPHWQPPPDQEQEGARLVRQY